MPRVADGAAACTVCNRQGALLEAPGGPGAELWAVIDEFPPKPRCGDCCDDTLNENDRYVRFKKACENCLTSTAVCWPLGLSTMKFPDADTQYVCRFCETSQAVVHDVRRTRKSRGAWESLVGLAEGFRGAVLEIDYCSLRERTLVSDYQQSQAQLEAMQGRLAVSMRVSDALLAGNPIDDQLKALYEALVGVPLDAGQLKALYEGAVGVPLDAGGASSAGTGASSASGAGGSSLSADAATAPASKGGGVAPSGAEARRDRSRSRGRGV